MALRKAMENLGAAAHPQPKRWRHSGFHLRAGADRVTDAGMDHIRDTNPGWLVLAIGGANRDEVLRLAGPLHLGASNRVRARSVAGGIARNVAQNLVALGGSAQLLAAIGDDEIGDWLLSETAAAGVDVSPALRRPGMATGRYVAVLDTSGELAVGLADMAATESLTPAEIEAASKLIETAGAVFADTNLKPQTLTALFKTAANSATPVSVDLVSPVKATRLPADLSPIDLVVGNRREAMALLGIEKSPVDLAMAIVRRGANAAVISDGDGPVGWCGKSVNGADSGIVPPPSLKVVDVTGAGDALHAGVIAARLGGAALKDAVAAGLKVAGQIVSSPAHALTSRPNQREL